MPEDNMYSPSIKMEWSPPVMRAIALIGGFVLLIVEGKRAEVNRIIIKTITKVRTR